MNTAELYKYANGVARSHINFDRGEYSILDDLVQGSLLAVLEDPESDPRFVIRNHIRNALARHRERGYDVKLWQDSFEQLWEDGQFDTR